MTTAYSKGAKRRAKQARKDMPGLEPIPKKQPNGRTRRQQGEGDPRKAALDARCDRYGLERNVKNRRAVSGAYSGSDAGRCIAYRRADHAASNLWSVWQGYCQANETYRARYIGVSESPKGASIDMAPERMETDQSHSVDPRSQEEKDRDAVSAYMRWEGLLMQLDRHQMTAIKAARTIDEGVLWMNSAPTLRGQTFISAISRLAALKGVDI